MKNRTFFILGLMAFSASVSAQDKGERGFIIKDVQIKRHDGSFDTVLRGQTLSVTKVEGGTLRVFCKGIGWIPKDSAASIDKAIENFTAAIKLNPQDAAEYVNRAKAWFAKNEFDISIADANEAIRLNPNLSSAFQIRGKAWRGKEENDKGVADLSEAIRLDPQDDTAYFNRGLFFYYEDHEKALTDFDNAIRLNPKNSVAYLSRASVWKRKKEFHKAINDFEEVIRFDPLFSNGYNTLSWMLATHPDAKIRNGKKAVEYATRMCELEDFSDSSHFDTLAAAYAEADDFPNAVKWQTKAVELATADEKADLQSRLDLYKMGKPYRQPQ